MFNTSMNIAAGQIKKHVATINNKPMAQQQPALKPMAQDTVSFKGEASTNEPVSSNPFMPDVLAKDVKEIKRMYDDVGYGLADTGVEKYHLGDAHEKEVYEKAYQDAKTTLEGFSKESKEMIAATTDVEFSQIIANRNDIKINHEIMPQVMGDMSNPDKSPSIEDMIKLQQVAQVGQKFLSIGGLLFGARNGLVKHLRQVAENIGQGDQFKAFSEAFTDNIIKKMDYTGGGVGEPRDNWVRKNATFEACEDVCGEYMQGEQLQFYNPVMSQKNEAALLNLKKAYEDPSVHMVDNKMVGYSPGKQDEAELYKEVHDSTVERVLNFSDETKRVIGALLDLEFGQILYDKNQQPFESAELKTARNNLRNDYVGKDPDFDAFTAELGKAIANMDAIGDLRGNKEGKMSYVKKNAMLSAATKACEKFMIGQPIEFIEKDSLGLKYKD